MPVSLETWLGYEEEFRAVQGRIASARAEGDVDALNPLHAERQKLLARASTALPARGPVSPWMIDALDEASPELSERSEFACRVIEHRRQFPRVYLGAVVRAGARFGRRGSGFIELASHAHGQELVLRAMVKAAREERFDPDAARFLLYYVRSRRWGGEDRSSRETCRALTEELRQVLPR